MARAGTIVASVALVVAGLALAGFYYLLFAIADCGGGCVARGERAVPVALFAIGIGMMGAGAVRLRGGSRRRTAGWGLAIAGLVAGIGAAVLFAEGTGGLVWWLLAGAIAALLAGGWLRRA